MSSPPAPETTIAADVLSEPQGRYLLAALLEQGATVPDQSSIETLATEVAATEHGSPIVSDDQCEQTQISLHHHHVPRLVGLGVLNRTTRGDVTLIGLADHSILETDWVRTVLEDPTGDAFPADEDTLDRTLQALREPRRRAVCAVLATRRGAVSVSELAATLTAREKGDEPTAADVSPVEQTHVAASLTHKHLPTLAAAGLVDYDPEASRAALAADAPQWEADWLLEGPLADAIGLERRADRRANTAEDRRETAPAETLGNGDKTIRSGRTVWMLARPPADRTDTSDASSRELTNPAGLSSKPPDSRD
ncbi:DUF7344 domain-containing protein [Natrinema marinum]|uniref:DUF7344 domain-containing protein n=1 Tax=Natrinema marinum TaxID=2961598 RepID=UPI0020C90997|nr:hypothetical protein [Natrinema marinum]